MSTPAPTRLVLASTSRYRRALLERLLIPFECIAPAVDETPLPQENATDMSRRLARLKAEDVASAQRNAIVIGSDQVALRGGEVLGKPGTAQHCRAQLRASSGQEVAFLTAVHVVDARSGRSESYVDRTLVRFRTLTDEEIERYIAADEPFDCAGGFKAESLGIALFESVVTSDPTALTGLPLIWLAGALRRAGFPVP